MNRITKTSQRPTRAVAILIHKRKMLLMKRWRGRKVYYVIPGGGVEEGENVEDAVLRELMEETSISAKIKRLVYHISYIGSHDQYFYLCEYIDGKPQMPHDSIEMQEAHIRGRYKPMWIPIDVLPRLLLFPLEVRDFIIEDAQHGFPKEVRRIEMQLKKVRQT